MSQAIRVIDQAAEIVTDVTNFDGQLSGSDTSVQLALETLDDLSVGAAGSTKQVQYNSGGSFAGATGFEYQSGASPNVTIVAQNAAYVPLLVKGAASQSANLFEAQDSNGNLLSGFDSVGRPFATLNTSTGSFIASDAGNTTFSGVDNIMIGPSSGLSLTTGFSNIAVGKDCLKNTTEGYENVAMGLIALRDTTTGYRNFAIGQYAGRNNTTGNTNFYFGYEAGMMGTDGSDNVMIGYQAGRGASASTGVSKNTLIGSEVASGLISSNIANTIIGYQAGKSVQGNYNTIMGFEAGTNSTGQVNTYIGARAGKNCDGDYNVFIGWEAGQDEAGSNKLYIANDTGDPLIYGEFDNDEVGINIGSGCAATLHVDQPAADGAKPVLLLDQADIDEDFLKIIGSSEDGVADRTLCDVADLSTPGALVGWFKIYVEDVQGTNPIADGDYYVPFYAAPSA